MNPIEFVESRFGKAGDGATIPRETWAEAADVLGPLVVKVWPPHVVEQ